MKVVIFAGGYGARLSEETVTLPEPHHKGFWQNMDTLRDKHALEEMWDSGRAPWKVWDRPAAAEPPAAHVASR